MSKGHIRQRGKKSWELKFDAGRDPATGKRIVRYHSFKGTKREAQVKLAELIASVATNTYMAPAKITIGEYIRDRIDVWEAKGEITARSAQRYRQLVENQIVPHLGSMLLQKVSTISVEKWHADLLDSGLAARTIGHAHRVLGKAMDDAVRHGAVLRNVVKLQTPPRVPESEMVIVKDVPAFMAKLPSGRLYVIGITGLFTGMRLGEILALRDKHVDLDHGLIQVREALEETRAHGIRFKVPKSRAGRRDLTLPDIVVDALREHRKQLLELRMQLGAGKLPGDALLFANLEGGPLRPSTISSDWGDLAESIGMPAITFHGLRHTHASQLIDAGVDIVTISQRLGHANPKVTLAIYAHMFHTDDRKAAAAINAALGTS